MDFGNILVKVVFAMRFNDSFAAFQTVHVSRVPSFRLDYATEQFTAF